MAQIDWYIEGPEFSNCNCDYACPCQFESPRPTHGDCRGFAAVRIDKGYFGDVPLDGLCGAVLYAWPGPIYEGNGEFQGVIDERADDKQRDALTISVSLIRRGCWLLVQHRRGSPVLPGVSSATCRPCYPGRS